MPHKQRQVDDGGGFYSWRVSALATEALPVRYTEKAII
jgi:hypothetical protein